MRVRLIWWRRPATIEQMAVAEAHLERLGARIIWPVWKNGGATVGWRVVWPR